MRPLIALVSIAILAGASRLKAQSTLPESDTLRIDTNLVVVDVVVTDVNQHPVHNLSASDFNLREDGRPQSIKTFEQHTLSEVPDASHQPPPLKLEPGVFTNDPVTPASGPLNIFLLDKLNTPMEDQAYSLDQLSLYLKSAPPNTRIAVARLTSWQLSLLQGFTSDPEMLRAAVSKKNNDMNASLFLADPVSGGNSTKQGADTRYIFRREHTLDALNQLGRYLAGFPGRKNLIWFSASFPFSVLPAGAERRAESVGSDDEFKETVNLLANNQVSVYPINAHGIITNSWFDASNHGAATVLSSNQSLATSIDRTSSTAAALRGSMTDIADPTGGKAFTSTNDLKGIVAQAIDAGSNYYTLTYSPTSRNWNGQYRKIEIQLDRPALNLAYRRGYYAIDPNAPAHPTERQANSTDPIPYSPMRAAMGYGAPQPSEIRFDVSVQPSIAATEPAPASGNHLSPKAKGPYRRYTIHYIAHQRDIQCPANAAGTNVCVVEFMAFVYDADGLRVNTQINAISAKIEPTHYARLHQPGLHPGFQYHQDISVPAKGEFFLRLGIHDRVTNHVGAVELPVAVVSTLPPLPAAPPASASNHPGP